MSTVSVVLPNLQADSQEFQLRGVRSLVRVEKQEAHWSTRSAATLDTQKKIEELIRYRARLSRKIDFIAILRCSTKWDSEGEAVYIRPEHFTSAFIYELRP